MATFTITDAEIEEFLNGFDKCIADDAQSCAGAPPTKEKSKGQICKKCNELYEYAEKPNQKDGTFICFSCRNY
jgi:hypothetical protein